MTRYRDKNNGETQPSVVFNFYFNYCIVNE